MGIVGRIVQYRNSNHFETVNMWKCLLIVCFVGVLTLASPTRDVGGSVKPVHIIKPPVRCPEGMKPDANGRCRVVWERSTDNVVPCPEGEESDEDGVCREICFGDECEEIKKITKRDVDEDESDSTKSFQNHRKMEALRSEKKNKRRSNPEAMKQARSKHAFLIMLKKKKMQQMMKPKPPPPPPPHHHPPHHHPPHRPESEEEEEPEEEEPPQEQPEDPPQRLFFGDEACVEEKNTTNGCQPEAEILQTPDANKEFKEWKPEKSSESSSSSDSSSSSSDSTGESEGGSGEAEDEVLEKAIKIKLMKLFRMRQMYGPALRRWLLNQLSEYDDSLN